MKKILLALAVLFMTVPAFADYRVMGTLTASHEVVLGISKIGTTETRNVALTAKGTIETYGIGGIKFPDATIQITAADTTYVNSVASQGATGITGDVHIKGATRATLTQSGQTIEVSVPDYVTLSGTATTAGYATLSGTSTNCTGGYITGEGSGITNINATNIASGTLNNSRLPQNISITGYATAESVAATSMNATTFTGALTGAASSNVLKAGDTMTGDLTIADNFNLIAAGTPLLSGINFNNNDLIQYDDTNNIWKFSCDGTQTMQLNNALMTIGSAEARKALSVYGTIETYGTGGVKFQDATTQITAGIVSGSSAGGDLTGTYPNPTIDTGKVTSTKILDDTIVNADINASAAIVGTKVDAGTSSVRGTVSLETSSSDVYAYHVVTANDTRLSDARTANGGNAATVTTNANLTGVITSVGNATSIASQTGSGTKFVVDTSPTLITPLLGTPTSGNLANCTGVLNSIASSGATGLTGVISIAGGSGASVTGDASATYITLNSTGLFPSALTADSPTFVVDATNHRVGIGTAIPAQKLDVVGLMQSTGLSVVGNSTFSQSGGNMYLLPTAYGGVPLIKFQRANGTSALPTVLVSGDDIAYITGYGYKATGWSGHQARLTFNADANWSDTSCPTRIVFYTTPTASTTIAERMRIDQAGNVGIGTAAPSAKLAINGGLHVGGDSDPGDNNLQVDGEIYLPSSANIYANGTLNSITPYNGANGAMLLNTNYGSANGGYYFKVAGTDKFVIDGYGNLKDAQVYASIVGATNRDLYIDNTGLFGYVSSSRKYKKNIRSITDASRIYDLNPVIFDYKDGKGNNQYGLIAEDVAELFPQVVSFNEDGSAETVDYAKIGMLLIPAIKELKAKNDILEARVKALEDKLKL